MRVVGCKQALRCVRRGDTGFRRTRELRSRPVGPATSGTAEARIDRDGGGTAARLAQGVSRAWRERKC